MLLHCYSLLHNIPAFFDPGVRAMLSLLRCLWLKPSISASIKSLRDIWLPVDFTKMTPALIAAMSRMLPHTASGYHLEADRVLYKQAI